MGARNNMLGSRRLYFLRVPRCVCELLRVSQGQCSVKDINDIVEPLCQLVMCF